jgi:hypothetical protein
VARTISTTDEWTRISFAAKERKSRNRQGNERQRWNIVVPAFIPLPSIPLPLPPGLFNCGSAALCSLVAFPVSRGSRFTQLRFLAQPRMNTDGHGFRLLQKNAKVAIETHCWRNRKNLDWSLQEFVSP